MAGVTGLVTRLLFGSGMRLLEGLRLRVKYLDFDRHEVLVRAGKGDKDRVTMLPASLKLAFHEHLARVRALHERDLADGGGEVFLPDALAVKFPHAPRAWGWQWVFPSATRSRDPRTGIVRRHHLHPETIQRADREAARSAELVKPVTPHVLNRGGRGVASPLDQI
jgi:integrase